MKTVVMYYSYSGITRKLATRLAKSSGGGLVEMKDVKKPGKLYAYTVGCFAAAKQRRARLAPVTNSLAKFDRIVFCAPVWAGFPAPAFNNMVDMLPEGKAVEVYLVSGGGKTGCEPKVRALIEGRKCTLAKLENIKQTEVK
ncbi:MAG: hypothetical protein GX558_00885 [Clostridiales bacterium]|nr:hypothetical protein [Clostridiales bacterium]